VSHVANSPEPGGLGNTHRRQGALARPNRHHPPFHANARPIDPRHAMLHRDVIEQIARLDVVGAVQQKVNGDPSPSRPTSDSTLPAWTSATIGSTSTSVLICQVATGSDGFGQSRRDIAFIKQDLSLQVGQFDQVSVDDS